jgi:DNA-binding NtrC family response regulator
METGGKKRATMPLVADVKRERVAALRVIGSGCEVPLPESVASFAIGSHPSNHLVLDDQYVSAFHCTLEQHPAGGLVLRDRQSRNGTYVNGTRVLESQVESGARIVVGGTALALVGMERRGHVTSRVKLIGKAPIFREAIELTLRAARTSSSALLLGESGTGKELFARLVHDASSRSSGPFVAVNCGAIPTELVESTLFGHEKGSFTGATEKRIGCFEQADGGTLFLDEIGELPRAQQPRLLRVLETRRVRRVGGEVELGVDVRVVSATHVDMRAQVKAGAMRLDLYHRLGVIELNLPPLRARTEDIPILAHAFLAEAIAEHGARTISASIMEELCRYAWPGNVRELRNAIHRAAALSDGALRLDDLLPPTVAGWSQESPPRVPRHVPGVDGPVDDIMRSIYEGALRRHGSIRRAAAALGMSKSTLHDRIREYGLTWRKDRDD